MRGSGKQSGNNTELERLILEDFWRNKKVLLVWKILLTFQWTQICLFLFNLILYIDEPFQLLFQLLERHCKPSCDGRYLNSKWSVLSFMKCLTSQHNASQDTGLCPEIGLLASPLLLCSHSLSCYPLSSHYTGCFCDFIDKNFICLYFCSSPYLQLLYWV